MKPFTDDQLKDLKKQIPEARYGFDSLDYFCFEDLTALLARLEAAEAVCDYVEKVYDPQSAKCLEVWRKAAGK